MTRGAFVLLLLAACSSPTASCEINVVGEVRSDTCAFGAVCVPRAHVGACGSVGICPRVARVGALTKTESICYEQCDSGTCRAGWFCDDWSGESFCRTDWSERGLVP
ncbi:MAG: hypothetical protein ACI9KE_000385 [Polyangiales bacterium]|jgi:hypothetical protein